MVVVVGLGGEGGGIGNKSLTPTSLFTQLCVLLFYDALRPQKLLPVFRDGGGPEGLGGRGGGGGGGLRRGTYTVTQLSAHIHSSGAV